jgi:FPC/CPF motif-containing protein YcgG
MLILQNQLETADTIMPQVPWRKDMALSIVDHISRTGEFPCLFAQHASRSKRLVFSFVDDLSKASFMKSASDLADYLERAASWDGSPATAEPLIMVFHPERVAAPSVAGYHQLAWSVLQFWHDVDPAAWPGTVANDPHMPYWSMCFSGVQIFVNISNPAHRQRRSRNLGSALTLVINPRERFDMVAGDTPSGRKIRQKIRERIEAYDGLAHSPALGSYVAGEIEWWQYGLTESNEPRTDRCPFRMRTRATLDDAEQPKAISAASTRQVLHNG